MFERQLPANVEAEQALLGAILCNNKALDYCVGLEPHHFSINVHGEIFRACRRRIEMGRVVDAIVLKTAFEHTGLLTDHGGVAYLVHLIGCNLGILTVGDYSRVVKDCWLRCKVIDLAAQASARAYGEDPDDDGSTTAAWLEDQMDLAQSDAGTSERTSLRQAVDQAVSQSERAMRGDASALGLSTGIDALDRMWGGLYAGSLDIVGARPKTGKSALALQIARFTAERCRDEQDGCVGILSLEMSAADLGLVSLASMTGISADDIRGGRYGTEAASLILKARNHLASLPIEIIDRPRITLPDAMSELRALKRKKGLRLAIIDHRNLFGRDEEAKRLSKLDWYAEITQRLKAGAKQLNIPILCLVQINRGVEIRDDPRPRMSDLEYAGEQDADNVLLLYRPELHFSAPPPQKLNQSEESHANILARFHEQRRKLKGVGEIIFAKRRFGAEGICTLSFHGPTTTWGELSDDAGPEPDFFNQHQ